MTRESVDKMLANYRANAGRCAYLEVAIREKEREIEKEKACMVTDAALASGDHEEGMPHGTGVGNPVERIVIKFADGYVTDEVRQMVAEFEGMQREYREKITEVRFVDAMLKGLNDRERWMIEHKVIDQDYSWREIIVMYRLQYGEDRSVDSVKRMKMMALEKIYQLAA